MPLPLEILSHLDGNLFESGQALFLVRGFQVLIQHPVAGGRWSVVGAQTGGYGPSGIDSQTSTSALPPKLWGSPSSLLSEKR